MATHQDTDMNEQIITQFRQLSAEITALSREARRIDPQFQSHKDRVAQILRLYGRRRALRGIHEEEYDEADYRDREEETGSYAA